MKSRVRYSAIAVTLVLAIALCGCSPVSVAPAAAREYAYWTTNELRSQYVEQKRQQWNKLNPDRPIAINTTVFPVDQIDNKLWTSLHSGVLIPGLEAPDLTDIEFHNFEKYVAPLNCLLYPLNGVMEGSYALSGGALWQFSAFSYRGMYFGVPYGSDRMVAVYQDDLLNQAQVDPGKIATWSDFLQAGEAYYSRTGNPMTAVDMDHYLLFMTVLCQQGDSAQVYPSEALYEDAMAFLEQLCDRSAAQIMPGGRIESRAFLDAFRSGEIACAFVRLSDLRLLSRSCPELAGKLSVREIPANGEKTRVCIPGSATAVTIACDDYELLMEFLKFARLDEDAQGDMLRALGSALAYPEAIDSGVLSFFRQADVSLYRDNGLDLRVPEQTQSFGKYIEDYPLALAEKIL